MVVTEKLRAQRKQWAATHHHKHPGRRATINRTAHFKRMYGITLEDYQRMFDQQHGRCAICVRPETARWKGQLRTLCVDHDHMTGIVRGLLCSSCNRAAGYLGDDPLRARSLADYLERA